ncbi:PKD domain-containing protein [Segetibacter sp.]|uniref:PKD domain-containing protein n=1 Tax=Segetibacter sp. TaxID=2231182 RepID=UPI00260968E0|nr:PKD domain-containing protein [Segetibacter sp.]MCW3082444.1 type sorting protein [Segetibacter sp.]
MKKISILIITLFSFLQTFASHIAGGELFYEYLGPGNGANTNKYKVTMRLFRDCHSVGQTLATERVVIGIYRSNELSLFTKLDLALQSPAPVIELNTKAIPCLLNAPEVCFQIGIFTGTIDLPSTPGGFTLSWIRCCRIEDIGNVVGAGIGGTFVTKIPGTALLSSGNNSSPQFAIKDTALVCQNKSFVLDFGASDPDSDLLTYSFCDAYSGGSSNNPNPGTSPGGVPSSLSLSPLPYGSTFNGQNPLGAGVKINSQTGKITGIAPSAGRYVINVCVTEWRNGVAINEHRKDFILQVGNCDYTAAEPIPFSGAYCKDFKVTFSNNSLSAGIRGYSWDFGVPGSTTDTSSLAQPVFTFPDTGLYKVRLIVRAEAGCVDTGMTTLGVYPGFKPDFDITGSCFEAPFEFKDKSTANYGVINSWSWNFGNLLTLADSSALKNPTYKYADTGRRNVSLIVTSSKGCTESITKTVTVLNKPYLALSFKDTLICSIDTLQLKAEGTGAFAWKPANNILNANTANPLVYPKNPTTYTVTLTENGCVATDTVRVNVLNFLSVKAGNDTSICSNDTVRLNSVSEALQYQWSPTSGISGIATSRNVVAKPAATTTYVITANLGNCQAKDSVKITVVPYPAANAGADATICFGKDAPLAANITGSSFNWSPSNSLTNATTLTPIAKPTQTTTYLLTVTDTAGCGRPVYDTVTIKVVPKVNAFAGNDTIILANQPLQLNASGGTVYSWSPSIGMNNPSIANPVVFLSASYDSITYKVRVGVPEGCIEEDELKVKLFKTGPDIFVPTAFTPNHDGRNDFLKPIAVGMKATGSFKVYNRWGQLVYSSAVVGPGWDGTLGGKEQAPGTYVFTAEGTDYLGKSVIKKGTVVLIR